MIIQEDVAKNYLKKYGQQEQYQRKLMFKDVEQIKEGLKSKKFMK